MTHRIHDLASLRGAIKANATRARELRQEARATSGLDRHDLKVEARTFGADTRYPHLALGYLRGRTISEMESESTHPENLPEAHEILWWARRAFLEGPDAPEWERETRIETRTVVERPDDRGFLAKLMGTPAPEPELQVKVRVESNDAPGWDEFVKHVADDILAWHAKCLVNDSMKLARRQAARAKREVA